jgi:AcrR family transcriptional regulator
MDGSPPTRPKRLRQIQKEQTRLRILDAARDMFYQKGFDNTSIGQIVEQAGVGRQTFYFHFGDREELIQEMISGYNSRGADVMRSLPSPDPRIEDLKAWLFELSDFVKEGRAEHSILFQLSYHPETSTAYGRPTAETWVAALAQQAPSFAAAQAGDVEGERARARAWRLIMDMTWCAAVLWQNRGTAFADAVLDDVSASLHAFLHDPELKAHGSR